MILTDTAPTAPVTEAPATRPKSTPLKSVAVASFVPVTGAALTAASTAAGAGTVPASAAPAAAAAASDGGRRLTRERECSRAPFAAFIPLEQADRALAGRPVVNRGPASAAAGESPDARQPASSFASAPPATTGSSSELPPAVPPLEATSRSHHRFLPIASFAESARAVGETFSNRGGMAWYTSTRPL